MSDTPRTDEAVRASKGQWSFELRDLCQNLERELAAVKEAAAAEFCRLNRDVTRQTDNAEKHRQRANELEEELREMGDQCQSWADSSRVWKARADKNWRELEQLKSQSTDDEQAELGAWELLKAARADLESCRVSETALIGQLSAWETELSKVMPPDFKDWWQNSKAEWPVVARMVIERKGERQYVESLERELEQERQDRKQAEADICRALGERNDARAELEQVKTILADPLAVHLNMMRGTIKWTPANLRALLGDTTQEP